jgi:hypothetical protein
MASEEKNVTWADSNGAPPPTRLLVATDPGTGTNPFRSLRTKAKLYFIMNRLSNHVSCNYYLINNDLGTYMHFF